MSTLKIREFEFRPRVLPSGYLSLIAFKECGKKIKAYEDAEKAYDEKGLDEDRANLFACWLAFCRSFLDGPIEELALDKIELSEVAEINSFFTSIAARKRPSVSEETSAGSPQS